jgi:hypothetical protein
MQRETFTQRRHPTLGVHRLIGDPGGAPTRPVGVLRVLAAAAYLPAAYWIPRWTGAGDSAAVAAELFGLSAIAGLVIGRRWAAWLPPMLGVTLIGSLYVARDAWSSDNTRATLAVMVGLATVVAELGLLAGLYLSMLRGRGAGARSQVRD